MRDSVVLSTDEVREIIATNFNVPIENVFRAKYPFIVITGKKVEDEYIDGE